MNSDSSPMKQHVSILGMLYIVFGALGVLLALGLLIFFGGIAGIVRLAGEGNPDAAVAVPIFGGIALLLFVVVSLFSIPGLIVGIGLVKLKSWARIGGLVLSILNLLNFPFGSALGAYGLWVLLSKDTESLFS